MRRFKIVLSSFLIAFSVQSFADETEQLIQYLQNLGKYFGYDITQYCDSGGVCDGSGASPVLSNQLVNTTLTTTNELNLFNTYLGALLNMTGQSNATIVPPNLPNYSVVNSLGAQTFVNPPYSAPSTQGVTVSPLMDQQTYQADPVSQAVFNILTTPNDSFCQTNDEKSWLSNCNYLFRDKIVQQLVGPIPPTDQFFSAQYNQNLVSQLNSEALFAPLLYSTAAFNTDDTSSTPQNTTNQGLQPQNQAQQAANFIRYVTGLVIPLNLAQRSVYDTLYAQSQNLDGKTSQFDQYNAQYTLSNYLMSVRSYAAQMSVVVSNLYHILSQRMPQNASPGNTSNPTSQALNEFVMATWRIYNPSTGNTPNQQWLSQINQASAATVQKEIAILLAEINYQLYLSRQQQERMLLTQSMILMQNIKQSSPDAYNLLQQQQ